MFVACGRIDITPEPGYPLAGYGVDEPRLAVATRSALFARCTVLADGDRRLVICTADVLGFPRSLHRAIRERVAALGVAPADFVLTATHTHNGPALVERLDPYVAYGITDQSAIEAYSDRLVARIAELVGQVLHAPARPCTLEFHLAHETFAVNRAGLPHAETQVPVLVARAPTGDPLAVLFGYGCHPISALVQTQFDADYPGRALGAVEQETGAFAQFLLGPAGDQNPAETGSWDLADRFGERLATTVLGAIRAGDGRPLAGGIRTSYDEVELPLDVPSTPDGVAAFRDLYVQRILDFSKNGYYRRHAEVMLRAIDRGAIADSVPLPLQVWRLGGESGLRMAFAGGEPVSAYGVRLRERYGSGLWFVGYANEVPTYLPTDELLFGGPAGAYEGGWNVDQPQIAGGCMTLYCWPGHLRGKAGQAGPDGVEQIVLAALAGRLNEA